MFRILVDLLKRRLFCLQKAVGGELDKVLLPTYQSAFPGALQMISVRQNYGVISEFLVGLEVMIQRTSLRNQEALGRFAATWRSKKITFRGKLMCLFKKAIPVLATLVHAALSELNAFIHQAAHHGHQCEASLNIGSRIFRQLR